MTEDLPPTLEEFEPSGSFGRYQDLQPLGEGGMAKVYRAFDPTLGRTIALKLISNDDSAQQERFRQEARLQARLEHPNICRIYEVGEVNGRFYIAMQYIEGLLLNELPPETTLEQKVRMLRQVAEAVHAAHRAGLIHRDLKPANVMVERNQDGEWIPYVLDFGLAREVRTSGLTMTGTIVGTPWYMSPEQATGETHNLDRRSDVFSLGVTLYETLTEHLPFEADSTVEVFVKLMQDDPPPVRQWNSRIPADLETITMKCLEKDPSDRYDSARVFAEELGRYLDGEPLLARPLGRIRRLQKKAKKHKAITSSAVVAFIIMLGLALVAVRTHFRAQAQASLAQQFGQEVKEIQDIMRFAHLLPLHSVEKERAMVAARLKRIEQRMKETGKIGVGPGRYALGRGHLSLQEPDLAKVHLEEAWKNGYQKPEVAYALGLALGELWKRELEELERIRDKELRKIRQAEIEELYRKPAYDYLQQGKNLQTEATEYAEGLLAFFAKDWQLAQRKALAAEKRIPWLYEAKLLQGNILFAAAREAMQKGENEMALEKLTQAATHYERSAKAGSSDESVYLSQCELLNTETVIRISIGQDPQPSYGAAVASCDQALVVNPQSAKALDQQAYIHSILARHEIDQGRDSRSFLEAALKASRHAQQLKPEWFAPYHSEGMAYWIMGEESKYRSLDPTDNLMKSISAFDRALTLNPTHVQTLNYRGNAYLYLGEYEMNQGKDPGVHLERAMENYREAIRIQPAYMSAHTNLGLAHWDLGMNAMAHGGDPRKHLQDAIASSEKASAINPNNAYPHNSMGTAYGILGSYAIEHGEDPSSLLDHSIQSFENSIAIKPDWIYPHANMGLGYLDKARYAVLIGKDPSRAVTDGQAILEKAIRLNPDHPDAYLTCSKLFLERARYEASSGISPEESLKQALFYVAQLQQRNPSHPDISLWNTEIDLVRIQWLIENGNSPQLFLQSAQANLARAEESNPTEARLHLSRMEFYRWKAEWGIRNRQNVREFVRLGLAAGEEVLQMNPELAEAYALRGILLLQKGRLTTDPGHRNDAIGEAGIAFQRALQINRNLKHGLQPYLRQIENEQLTK